MFRGPKCVASSTGFCSSPLPVPCWDSLQIPFKESPELLLMQDLLLTSCSVTFACAFMYDKLCVILNDFLHVPLTCFACTLQVIAAVWTDGCCWCCICYQWKTTRIQRLRQSWRNSASCCQVKVSQQAREVMEAETDFPSKHSFRKSHASDNQHLWFLTNLRCRISKVLWPR